jgi:hypothetical protein
VAPPGRDDDGMEHRTTAQLIAGLEEIRQSPTDGGRLELIVRRPAVDQREVLEEGRLDLVAGLVGDTWSTRGSRETADGSAHPDRQLNLMNARAATLIAGDIEHWPLAGDQMFVDLHLGVDELPPGTRLRLGEAVIEVTELPHLGCAKFTQRFGLDAMRFVNSPEGKALNLRGICAKVVVPGAIRRGDEIVRVGAFAAAAG